MTYKTDSISHSFSVGEILANSITHGIGVGLSIAGLVFLILRAAASGSGWHLVSFIIFGISLILLYLASTLYHSTPGRPWNGLLQRLDHSAIFFLIAGTYTPFLLTKLRGAFGWTIFGLIWGLSIAALVIKLRFRHKFARPSVWVYVAMSWFALIIFNQAMMEIGMASLNLLLIGGASYMLGIIFYRWRKLPYSHAIWHLFVMGGSIFHYFSVLQLA